MVNLLVLNRFFARRWAAPALALLLSSVSGRPASAVELELAGTWFVVVHYTDEGTANPDATRWLDRVWTFESEGSRLRWTEYPIVVLSDESGRFEASAGNPHSRVLAAWTPNEGQLAELEAGPRVNHRGSKSKSLRRTKSGNWASQGKAAVRSATVVGYQETWSIENPTTLPRFAILDVLGIGTSKGDSGGSIYEVTEVSNGGDELRGRYERDDDKRGSFRMLRTAPVRSLVTTEQEGTPNDRAQERMRQQWIDQAQDPE
jgi:hypothetical protein